MPHPAAAQPARDIVAGLSQPAPCISCKYFYDDTGSALFEQITHLPEYYPTRTEQAIMQRHGREIAQRARSADTVIELGAGSCRKARDLCALVNPERFVAVDISADFLHQAAAELREALPGVAVMAFAADITADIQMPPDVPKGRRLVFYPGSSIGNFDKDEALMLLRRMRGMIDDDGAVLIGIDLIKDPAVLQAAYDDASGVTAAFNRNLLRHVNRLIGSDFVPEHWQHEAVFNAAQSRIEMHLVATLDSLVIWPGGGRMFNAGQRIHTENSYKYDIEGFSQLLHTAGFPRSTAWTDDKRWFAVVLAQP